MIIDDYVFNEQFTNGNEQMGGDGGGTYMCVPFANKKRYVLLMMKIVTGDNFFVILESDIAFLLLFDWQSQQQ